MNLVELYKRFKPSSYQSLKDLTVHVGMLSSTIYAMWYTKESYMSYALVPLLALLHVKSLVILHDCGHNSFTPCKKLNYIIGTLLGINIFIPFSWTYDHLIHHKTSGNKTNNSFHEQNETIHHTFKQYNNMNIYSKNITKLWRIPCIYITILPFISLFIIKFRLDTLSDKIIYNKHNISIYKILFDIIINHIWIIILYSYTYIQYPLSVLLSYSIDMAIFHNQHTFNKPYVKINKEWTKENSGLKGSSFIQVPSYLKFFTYGIEYHHIHHMVSSIPGYNLKDTHEYLEKTEPEFKNIIKLSMNDCYNNLWLTLYDEEADRYISFKEADDKIKNDKIKND